MKKILLPLFAILLVGAADPIKTAPANFSGFPTYENGVLTAATWNANFTQWAMVDGERLSAQKTVTWDGMRTDFVVVVDGMKLTPAQISQATGLIAAYILANPPQSP